MVGRDPSYVVHETDQINGPRSESSRFGRQMRLHGGDRGVPGVVAAGEIPIYVLEPVAGVDVHAIVICVPVRCTNESWISPDDFLDRCLGAHHVGIQSVGRSGNVGGLGATPFVAPMIDKTARMHSQDMAFSMNS